MSWSRHQPVRSWCKKAKYSQNTMTNSAMFSHETRVVTTLWLIDLSTSKILCQQRGVSVLFDTSIAMIVITKKRLTLFKRNVRRQDFQIIRFSSLFAFQILNLILVSVGTRPVQPVISSSYWFSNLMNQT